MSHLSSMHESSSSLNNADQWINKFLRCCEEDPMKFAGQLIQLVKENDSARGKILLMASILSQELSSINSAGDMRPVRKVSYEDDSIGANPPSSDVAEDPQVDSAVSPKDGTKEFHNVSRNSLSSSSAPPPPPPQSKERPTEGSAPLKEEKEEEDSTELKTASPPPDDAKVQATCVRGNFTPPHDGYVKKPSPPCVAAAGRGNRPAPRQNALAKEDKGDVLIVIDEQEDEGSPFKDDKLTSRELKAILRPIAVPRAAASAASIVPRTEIKRPEKKSSNKEIRSCEDLIMNAMTEMNVLGITSPPYEKVTCLAAHSYSRQTISTAFLELSRKQFIEVSDSKEAVRLSTTGKSRIEYKDQTSIPTTNSEVHDRIKYVLKWIDSASVSLFDLLKDGETHSRHDIGAALAEEDGFSSRSFQAGLALLNAMNIVDFPTPQSVVMMPNFTLPYGPQVENGDGGTGNYVSVTPDINVSSIPDLSFDGHAFTAASDNSIAGLAIGRSTSAQCDDGMQVNSSLSPDVGGKDSGNDPPREDKEDAGSSSPSSEGDGKDSYKPFDLHPTRMKDKKSDGPDPCIRDKRTTTEVPLSRACKKTKNDPSSLKRSPRKTCLPPIDEENALEDYCCRYEIQSMHFDGTFPGRSRGRELDEKGNSSVVTQTSSDKPPRAPALVRQDPRQIEKVSIDSGRVLEAFSSFDLAADAATDSPQKWCFIHALEGVYGKKKNSRIYNGYLWQYKGTNMFQTRSSCKK